MNRRRCEICDIDIHKASYCRHLRSEKHTVNERKFQMEWGRKFLSGGIEMVLKTTSGGEINFDRDRFNQFYSKLCIGPNQ